MSTAAKKQMTAPTPYWSFSGTLETCTDSTLACNQELTDWCFTNKALCDETPHGFVWDGSTATKECVVAQCNPLFDPSKTFCYVSMAECDRVSDFYYLDGTGVCQPNTGQVRCNPLEDEKCFVSEPACEAATTDQEVWYMGTGGVCIPADNEVECAANLEECYATYDDCCKEEGGCLFGYEGPLCRPVVCEPGVDDDCYLTYKECYKANKDPEGFPWWWWLIIVGVPLLLLLGLLAWWKS